MTEGYFLMDERQFSRIDLGSCYSMENMERHIGRNENVTYMGSRIREYRATEDRTLFDYYRGESGRWWYRSRTLKQDGTIIDTMAELDRLIKESRERRRRKHEHESFGNLQELETGEEQEWTDQSVIRTECV